MNYAFTASNFVLNQNDYNMENAKNNSNKGGPLVTIAFKTTQQRKDNWQEQADFANLSLSSYLDSRLELVEENEDKFYASISELKKQLAFYENSRLLDFLKQLQGKHFNFLDSNGNAIELTVNTVADVFTLLIHSFKLE